METFLWAIAGVLAFCVWVGLLFMALVAAVSDRWAACAVASLSFIVMTAGTIAAVAHLEGESCPTGTTREYQSTGYKSGYHYCLESVPR